MSLRQIAEYYLMNPVDTGIVIGIQYSGILLAPLFIGTLSGRFGNRKILILSYALLVCGAFAVYVSNRLPVFYIAIFTIGAGFSILEATTTALLASEFKLQSKWHIGISQAAFCAGAIIGPFIATAIFQLGFSFKEGFLFTGLAFFVSGIAFITTKTRKESGAFEKNQPIYAAFRNLKSPVFLMLAAMLFAYVGIEEIIAFYADSYFKLVLGDVHVGAFAVSVYWGMMIPSRLAFGFLRVKNKTILAASAIMIALSLVGAMAVSNIMVKLLFLGIAGLASGPIWPLLMFMAAERFPALPGPTLNIMMSAGGFGGAAMPFIAGLLANFTNYSFAYYFAAMAAIFIFFAALGKKENRVT